ncbi:MAG: hypothetical protein HW374_1080 [Bacteroidetes bacterium]|nr:hypothetical protein [Bacteroidota bacterium]
MNESCLVVVCTVLILCHCLNVESVKCTSDFVSYSSEHLGFDFVDILPARPSAAGCDEIEFSERNEKVLRYIQVVGHRVNNKRRMNFPARKRKMRRISQMRRILSAIS